MIVTSERPPLEVVFEAEDVPGFDAPAPGTELDFPMLEAALVLSVALFSMVLSAALASACLLCVVLGAVATVAEAPEVSGFLPAVLSEALSATFLSLSDGFFGSEGSAMRLPSISKRANFVSVSAST